MVCDVLRRLAWIHDRSALLHHYIPYYNRAAVLTCTAFGAVVVSGMRWRRCNAVIRSSVAQVAL
nr:MAG TPA: hypothetical protein [Caudoviricetes sp.]